MGRFLRVSAIAICLGCGSSSSGTDSPPPADPDAGVVAPPPSVVDGVPTVGIFVTGTAKTDGDGSVSSPVRTIGVAIERARSLKIPIFVCAETYAENLDLADVTIDGNWECPGVDWKRSEKRATIRAPKSPAVVAHQLQSAQFKGFDVYAPDLSGAVAGEREGSSIALFVDRSKIDVSASSFHGGNAAPGANGTVHDENVSTTDLNGAAGKAQQKVCNFGTVQCLSYGRGVAGGVSTCKTAETSGGAGGAGGDGIVDSTGDPNPNINGRPFTATATTAKGGAGRALQGQTVGDGAPGAPGTPGQDGTNGSWAFDEQGFRLIAATNGKAGAGGQGGGGGGSQGSYTKTGSDIVSEPPGPNTSAMGSGGGAGGCGGFPGTAGTGGAASIGALVINGTVTFSKVELIGGAGGAAGRGTVGSSGYNGGGPISTPQFAGAGGAGGVGGPSGLSGNGAAGPSIAYAWTGARATTTDVTLTPGQGGATAPELKKKDKVLPATTGEAKAEHSF